MEVTMSMSCPWSETVTRIEFLTTRFRRSVTQAGDRREMASLDGMQQLPAGQFSGEGWRRTLRRTSDGALARCRPEPSRAAGRACACSPQRGGAQHAFGSANGLGPAGRRPTAAGPPAGALVSTSASTPSARGVILYFASTSRCASVSAGQRLRGTTTDVSCAVLAPLAVSGPPIAQPYV